MTAGRQVSRVAALAVALLLAAPALCAATAMEPARIAVPDLVALPPEADGALVRIQGEAIGEALRAGEQRVWLNVLDGGTAVGVIVTRSQASAVDGYGDWDRTGTTIEIVGTLNLACDEHEGDLDVHAKELEVVAASVLRSHPVRQWEAFTAAVALAGGASLLGVVRLLRRRRALL